jgi:TolB-like protein/Tfp pilus assembly protein PilF
LQSVAPGSDIPRLELLGGFRLTMEVDREIAISSRKNRALLAILALAPGNCVTRDELVALLWADRGEQQARNSLRQALVALRRDLSELDPSPLVIQDDQIKLDLAHLRVDVISFQSLVEVEDWPAAASLYKGALLSGLSLGGDAFEDWLREQRDIVAGKAIVTLERFAERQQGEARIATAKRLLALDPLREASHRALMSAYADTGEVALALKQYEACRAVLMRELGVAPAQPTEDLRRFLSASGASASIDPSRPRTRSAKSSVALLPFVNLGHEAEQQHLCDGIVADIISALARFHSLSVIARNSSFAFRDSTLPIVEVGYKLGVDYLVTGSLRMADKRLRLSVELIDVETERVVWAQTYARELADLFAVQDEVANTIAATLTGQLESDVAVRAERKHPGSLAAYDVALRGYHRMQRITREDTGAALELLERALTIDPTYAEAYSWLATALVLDWQFNYRAASLQRAIAVARQGVERDSYSGRCHLVLGYCLLVTGERVRAEPYHHRAIALNPNDAYILAHWALLEAYSGRPDESDRYLANALRLNPYPPDWYGEFRSVTAFARGRYDQARAGFEIAPDTYWDRLYLLACYGHLDAEEEATALLAWFRTQFPNLALIDAAKIEPFAHESDRVRLINGLEKAQVLAKGANVVRLERRS